MRHLHFYHMNSDQNLYFIRRMINAVKKEKGKEKQFL